MKKGLILASFGTTHPDTRKKTIENIEKRITQELKDVQTIRCFTSRMVVKRIKEQESIDIYNEKEALVALENLGIAFEDIYIQPLHVIPGVEYQKLQVVQGSHLGKPLLYDEKSMEDVIDSLNFPDREEASFVLFGHGSYHESDKYYIDLQKKLREKGLDHVFIVTAEGSLSIEDILEDLVKRNKKVILQPFMIVAGEHAKKDMSSDDEDSLKSIIEKTGLETQVRMKGLGEEEGIVKLFIQRAKDLVGECV